MLEYSSASQDDLRPIAFFSVLWFLESWWEGREITLNFSIHFFKIWSAGRWQEAVVAMCQMVSTWIWPMPLGSWKSSDEELSGMMCFFSRFGLLQIFSSLGELDNTLLDPSLRSPPESSPWVSLAEDLALASGIHGKRCLFFQGGHRNSVKLAELGWHKRLHKLYITTYCKGWILRCEVFSGPVRFVF